MTLFGLTEWVVQRPLLTAGCGLAWTTVVAAWRSVAVFTDTALWLCCGLLLMLVWRQYVVERGIAFTAAWPVAMDMFLSIIPDIVLCPVVFCCSPSFAFPTMFSAILWMTVRRPFFEGADMRGGQTHHRKTRATETNAEHSGDAENPAAPDFHAGGSRPVRMSTRATQVDDAPSQRLERAAKSAARRKIARVAADCSRAADAKFEAELQVADAGSKTRHGLRDAIMQIERFFGTFARVGDHCRLRHQDLAAKLKAKGLAIRILSVVYVAYFVVLGVVRSKSDGVLAVTGLFAYSVGSEWYKRLILCLCINRILAACVFTVLLKIRRAADPSISQTLTRSWTLKFALLAWLLLTGSLFLIYVPEGQWRTCRVASFVCGLLIVLCDTAPLDTATTSPLSLARLTQIVHLLAALFLVFFSFVPALALEQTHVSIMLVIKLVYALPYVPGFAVAHEPEDQALNEFKLVEHTSEIMLLLPLGTALDNPFA